MKQQQLTFEKGMTNVPSDAICSDNALEYAEGMIFRDGEHHVIQAPEPKITTFYGIGSPPSSIEPTILFIHTYNTTNIYIGSIVVSGEGGVNHNELIWGTLNESTKTFTQGGYFIYNVNSRVNYTGVEKFTAIGKTLIISTSFGLLYFLWNGSAYSNGYSEIPSPDVEFRLVGVNTSDSKVEATGTKYSNWLMSSDGIYTRVNPLYQNDWNNLIIGLHSQNKKDLHHKKRFYGTFSVRVALRMYDGTFSKISNPIIMFNQFLTPCLAHLTIENVVHLGMRGQELQYYNKSDFSEWKDLISEIVIFVSREADIYDTTGDAICQAYDERTIGTFGYCISHNIKRNVNASVTPSAGGVYYKVLENNTTEEDAIKDVVENGIFYKLCSIGVEGTSGWKSVDTNITNNTLETITTQEQLGEDDFYGHTQYIPTFIHSYNSRLNLANVSRSMFAGFSYFLPYDDPNGTNHNYEIYVKIKTDSGERVVKKEFTTAQKQGIWFYYPDPRATHVYIKKDTNWILNEELKEHPALNGAYYFQGNLTSGDDEPGTIAAPSVSVNNAAEILPNYIITSEVNNPFVFKAAGYYKVGTGKILAMSTITQALSEGQFGQFPLLVFSESGIWTLSVASTGYYTSINPMSREVSVDPARIIQTDGAVFFVSKKGLMVVDGSKVVCVSEQMKGKKGTSMTASNRNLGDFSDFLSTAFIAYDYRDSLLWIFDGTGTGSRYCYVYSIKSGTYSMFDFGDGVVIERAVNNYPDYLLQRKSNHHVYSLTNRVNVNADISTYSPKLKSRPMKLENALALKRIIRMIHVKDFQNGSIAFSMYGSNDAKNWWQLTSLRSIPWKYYRFEYSFSGLKATDTFSGTVVVTEEVRTDKIR